VAYISRGIMRVAFKRQEGYCTYRQTKKLSKKKRRRLVRGDRLDVGFTFASYGLNG